MDARLFAVLGGVLLAGAIANEVTNIPVTLPQNVLMMIVGLGGLCLAVFLMLGETDRP